MVSNEVSSRSGSKVAHVFALILVAIITFICTYIFLYLNRPVIYNGVKVNGIEAGGMTPDELLEFLRQSYANTDHNIELNVQDKQYNITFSDIYYYDFKDAADRAYRFGREGNIFTRLKDIVYARTGNKYVNFSVEPAVDEKKASILLDEIAREVNKPAVNAGIAFKDNGIINIIPHQVGYELDKDASLDILKLKPDSSEIWLSVREVEPKITSNMLSSIKGIISQYSTVFNSKDINRTLNLQTAANAINGHILLPGEEFSLNKMLGPRIKENGYLEAPVIINGKLVPDYGGGVCQIATTVYNAAVRANLDITERHHHSFPVAYVPVGQDATISGDVLDFRFKNNFKDPIYMRAYIKSNRFFVDIYGNNTSQGLNIHLSTEVLNVVEPITEYKEDKTLPPGAQVVEREPHKGYKVNVYKLTYDKNNKLLKKELLHTDTYKPVNGIIRRNSDLPASNELTSDQQIPIT